MIVGHSFVRDLKTYTESKAADDGFKPAIDRHMLWQGQYNVNRLRLNKLYSYVNMEWAYLFRSKEMDEVFRKVQRIRPQVLLVISASNDICEITKKGGSVKQLAREMRDRARELRDRHGIGNITFMSVINGARDSKVVRKTSRHS